MLINLIEEYFDFDVLLSFCILKVYFFYNIVFKSVDEGSKCKYIYVVWNLKDVVVLYFNFVISLKVFGNGFNGFWEFYIKLFVEGNGKFDS